VKPFFFSKIGFPGWGGVAMHTSYLSKYTP
jgi:hypothetical protein